MTSSAGLISYGDEVARAVVQRYSLMTTKGRRTVVFLKKAGVHIFARGVIRIDLPAKSRLYWEAKCAVLKMLRIHVLCGSAGR